MFSEQFIYPFVLHTIPGTPQELRQLRDDQYGRGRYDSEPDRYSIFCWTATMGFVIS